MQRIDPRAGRCTYADTTLWYYSTEVDLVANAQRLVRAGRNPRADIANQQHVIGCFSACAGTADALGFDGVRGVAQARRIHQRHGHPAQHNPNLQGIAGGSRHR